jgi:nitroimidazol reductase NimA-like FMN-containing flavoprotein (pyridoxamine 5'-phosphate oxidase superfamily)
VIGQSTATEPRSERPAIPKGYGVPDTLDGTREWSWARERLESTINYWVATVRPDDRPHVHPIWGVWIDERFYSEGGSDTRWARNIAQNPAVVVHVERGDDAVIVHGSAEEALDPPPELEERLIEAFGAKYQSRYGYTPKPGAWREGGLYAVTPSIALAWGRFPKDVTRFRFADAGAGRQSAASR